MTEVRHLFRQGWRDNAAMGTTTVLIGGGVHDSVIGGLFTVDPEQYWSQVYGTNADLHWSVRFVAESSELLIGAAKEAYRTGNYAPLAHAGLEVLGLIPVAGVVFDTANGVFYAYEGNGVDAAISFGQAIPIYGYAFNYVKLGNQAGKFYRATKALDIGINLATSTYFVQQGVTNGSGLQVGMGVFGFGVNGLAIARFNRGADAASTVGLLESSVQRKQTLWTYYHPGVQVRQFGDVWVKRTDPNANSVLQWWGRQTINAQYRALIKLGDMATPFQMRNGKLFTQHVGETFTGGRFSPQWFNPIVIRNYIKGSYRLGTPINDIIPRNMGRNGLIFDPAIDWFTQTVVAGAGIGITGGLYYVGDYFWSDE